MQKVLNGEKLSGHYLASVVKMEGTLRIFVSLNFGNVDQ
jgi:hypothetical protein